MARGKSGSCLGRSFLAVFLGDEAVASDFQAIAARLNALDLKALADVGGDRSNVPFSWARFPPSFHYHSGDTAQLLREAFG